mmetsp:Transcript_43510/g.41989  ORF Transcript_43510/g.41989 Transcript_43510/m.41989 type:complete len:90 (-) Transcript_43510:30-299(-)
MLSGYKLQQNNGHGIQIFPNQIKFNIISQLIKAMDKNDSNFNEKFQRLKKACNDQAQWIKDPRAGMQVQGNQQRLQAVGGSGLKAQKKS